MSTRSLASVALLLLSGLPLSAQEAALHLFNGREVAPHQHLANGNDPSELVQLLESQLAATYRDIRADRSLLLSDCGAGSRWCGNPAFSFSSIFSIAAAAGGYQPQPAAQQWYASAAGEPTGSFVTEVAPWKGWPLDGAPFQLLAIVNRIDLATWQGDRPDHPIPQWTGAEVRFVYGRIPRGTDENIFTLILEFSLPPRGWAEFQKLAGSWQRLSTVTDDQVLPALNDALRESGYQDSPLVRLRVNRSVAGAKWEFFQWEFAPQLRPLAATPLTDQIDLSFLNAQPGSNLYDRYIQLWKPPAPPSGVPIDTGFLAPSGAAYTTGSKGLAMPRNLCSAGGPARNILGLQQCTLCHSAESGTTFTHISNRDPHGSSSLSGFLVGSSAHNRKLVPGLRGLYYQDPDGAFEVAVNYLKCDQQTVASTTRHFSDLARRGLFLSAVINQATPGAAALQQIRTFATDYSH